MAKTSVTLLEGLQKRNCPEAWTRFVRMYTPILFNWTRSLNISLDHAEDFLQEVFLLVHRKIPMFIYDPGKSFRSWLKCLLRNLYIDYMRKNNPGAISNYNMNSFPDQLHENYWSRSFQLDLLVQGLEGIRGDFSAPVMMAFELSIFQKYSIQETADILGESPAMVYRSRSRVLQRLREFVDGM